jgi:hypothetical protein
VRPTAPSTPSLTQTPDDELPAGRLGQRPDAASGGRRVTAAEVQMVLAELRAFVKDHREATVEVTWRVVE